MGRDALGLPERGHRFVVAAELREGDAREGVHQREMPPVPGRDLGAALATATCALLGTGTAAPAVAQDLGQWRVDAAGLYYSEQHRVTDYSVNVLARTQPFEDRLLSFTVSVDTLSGASPNGAAPSALVKFPGWNGSGIRLRPGSRIWARSST